MKKIGEAHLGKSYNKDFLVIPVVKPLWFSSNLMLWKAPDYLWTNKQAQIWDIPMTILLLTWCGWNNIFLT